MEDDELFALAGQAQDFILDSLKTRSLVNPGDVGAHLNGISVKASNSERHFAVMSAIATLRSNGLVLFGDNDSLNHGVAPEEAFRVPLVASLLANRDIAVRGQPVVEKQNPFHSLGGRPIIPTARCLHLFGQHAARAPATRWAHIDELLAELVRVVHLGSELGAAGLARAIVEEAVRSASSDINSFEADPDWGLAKAIAELFDHLKTQEKRRMRFKLDSCDYSAARSTLDNVRCLGNAALHTAVAPRATELHLAVFATLPRSISWLSGASDPSL